MGKLSNSRLYLGQMKECQRYLPRPGKSKWKYLSNKLNELKIGIPELFFTNFQKQYVAH